MQVKNQQLEPDVEQQTGSKLLRSKSRLYIVTLLFNLYAEWKKVKVKSLSHVRLFATHGL